MKKIAGSVSSHLGGIATTAAYKLVSYLMREREIKLVSNVDSVGVASQPGGYMTRMTFLEDQKGNSYGYFGHRKYFEQARANKRNFISRLLLPGDKGDIDDFDHFKELH